MRKVSVTVGVLLLAAMPCLAETAAGEPAALKGTWSLNNWVPGDSVHLKLSFRKATTRWEWGNDQPLADLKGLTGEQLHATSASVAFTLERDAGTFVFDGSLMLGIGRGAFRFVPDTTYATKLAALGYGPLEDDDVSIMMMAVRDVSLLYAAEVKRSGLKDLHVSDLVRFQDHGVSLPFLRDVNEFGAANLTGDDIVLFRDHGIDGPFLRGLKAAGSSGLSAEDIVRLRDHGVGPDYVARIQSAGYPDLTVDQIIKLHDHGVN